jgi:hypothetical protein
VLNLANNDIGKPCRGTLKEKPSWWNEEDHGGTYGWSDDHYEEGKPEGAIHIANAIKDMRAMTKFDISANDIRAEGGKALAEGLKGNQVIKELNFSGNNLGCNSNLDTDTSGIIAIADVIPGMGAMTSLNLASNRLGAEGAKIVAEAIMVTMCTPAIIVAPLSCPSDFSINCCCLLLSTWYGGDDEPESCIE